jgi:hemolysin activation/secretion protein
VFYDMGRTWGQGAVDSSHKLLKDVGFGLRLGNSRTSLGNVIHIDVAFPLDGDSSIKKAQFVVEVKESF